MTAMTTRRAILVAATVLPIAAPTFAAGSLAADDHIYEQINAHRTAQRKFLELLRKKSTYDGEFFARGEKPDGRYGEAERKCGTIAHDAAWNLISTVPATLPGLAALMRCVREDQSLCEKMAGDDRWYAMYLGSIEDFVCAMARLPMPATAAVLLESIEIG